MSLSADLHDIFIAQATKLVQEIDQTLPVGNLLNKNSYFKEIEDNQDKDNQDYEFISNFSDGILDGENNFKPIAYQWFNSDYRQGYLTGMARRIGIEYAFIYEDELNKVIFT